jgi:hypothetical protein
MIDENATERASTYNQHLLLDAKRNAVLELWVVQRYSSDSYADADYVSVSARRRLEDRFQE